MVAGLLPAGLYDTIKFSAGQTRANNAILGLPWYGALQAYNDSPGTVHFIVDVTGYFY